MHRARSSASTPSGDVELRRELAAIFATRTQAEWVQLFIEADVPGGPVHTRDEPARRSAVPSRVRSSSSRTIPTRVTCD